jgi:hypothetical protein
LNYKVHEKNKEINTIISALKKEIITGKKNLKKYSEWCEEKEELTNPKLTKTDTINQNLQRINSTNINSNNFSKINSKGNISYISNISVTINQFFDRPKNNINIQNNNLLKSNNTIIESEQEDNKANNIYKSSVKKDISLVNKNKENQVISNVPINNFINIVVNNDDNNANNIKDEKNEDKIFINEYINIK